MVMVKFKQTNRKEALLRMQKAASIKLLAEKGVITNIQALMLVLSGSKNPTFQKTQPFRKPGFLRDHINCAHVDCG